MLTVELFLPHAHSLKERRSTVNSIKERVRNRFNVSVSEADMGEVWQRAGLIVSAAGTSQSIVEGALRDVVAFIEDDERVSVLMPQLRFYE